MEAIKVNKDRNDENVSNVEVIDVLLVHCNIANNNYQRDSRVLYTFIPNKLFDKLLDIIPKNLIFLRHLNENFHILKYSLLIKVLNRYRE